MPREHKKRGRREEKKRKREAEDAEPLKDETAAVLESQTKKQRQSPLPIEGDVQNDVEPKQDYWPIEAENDDAQMIDAGDHDMLPTENDGYYQDNAAMQAPAAPDGDEFFGILTPDDQAYFKRADAMLELDNFGSPEERDLFLASVWREAEAKELKLACAQSCSRILERLVKVSPDRQLKKLWLQFRGHFLFLVQHRFASHVCESLFIKAASTVTKELVNGGVENEDSETTGLENGAEGENEQDESAAILMESLFLEVVGELSENMGFLMTDKFASHALRVLLVVLGGKPLEDSTTTKTLQSKSKEGVGSTVSKPANGRLDSRDQWRKVPDSFGTALQKVSSQTIGTLDSHYLRALATQPVGNPVLQLLLELEFVSQGKLATKSSAKSLFRRLLPDDPPDEGTESARFIKGLLYDPVGSRLLEVILQHAPGKTFKSIYQHQIRENLANALKNEVASFVCLRALERISRQDLSDALEQISSELPSLIERCRHSVIKVLVERCRAREMDVTLLAKAFRTVFGAPAPGTFEKIVLMESKSEDPPNDGREPPAHSAQKMHASLLVQSILQSPDELREYINSTLVAASSLSRIACDRQATHALQAALTSPSQEKGTRARLLQSLIKETSELATDPVGSHVLDAVWTATKDGPVFLRERVAEQLSGHEVQVRDSFSGRGVWRAWSMDLYQRRKDAWVSRMKAEDDAVKDSGHRAPQREKTGIEKARERYAARRQGANAVKLGPGGVFQRRKNAAPVTAS